MNLPAFSEEEIFTEIQRLASIWPEDASIEHAFAQMALYSLTGSALKVRAEAAEAKLRAYAACIGTVRGMLGLPAEDISPEHVERYSREIVAERDELAGAVRRLAHDLDQVWLLSHPDRHPASDLAADLSSINTRAHEALANPVVRRIVNEPS